MRKVKSGSKKTCKKRLGSHAFRNGKRAMQKKSRRINAKKAAA